MAIRTLESPGVEITERDLSQYVNGNTGTAVLVTGFASKGRDYEPILLTSRSAWLQQFDEPTNEAERYFFNACMEVINQGGKVYACKLPYKNDALNKFVGKTYTVNVSDIHTLSTVAEYIKENHLEQVIAGDYTQFGSTIISGDLSSVLWNVDTTKSALDQFIKTVKQHAIAIPYAFADPDWMGVIDIPNCSADNWMWTPVQFIYAKTSAMFDSESVFREKLRDLSSDSTISGFFVDNYGNPIVPLKLNLSAFGSGHSTTEYIAIMSADIQEHLGGDPTNPSFKAACDPSLGFGLNAITATFPEFLESKTYRFFKDNELLFNALNKIDFENDRDILSGQKPYMYCDETKFNIGAYWRAINAYNKVKTAQEQYNNTNVVPIINTVIDLNKAFEDLDSSLSTIFDPFLNTLQKSIIPGEISTGHYVDEQNDALKEFLLNRGTGDYLITPLEVLEDAFKKLVASDEFKALLERTKENVYEDTPFAKLATKFYIEHTVIPNANIQKELRDAKNLNIFYKKFNVDSNVAQTSSATVFEAFNGPESASPELSSIAAVVDGTINSLFYDEFLQYAINFTSTDTYAQLSNYAYTEGEEIHKQIVDSLLSDNITSDLAYSEIKRVDNTVNKYMTIGSDSDVRLFDIETIDGYATGEIPVSPNTFVIVDKTRGTLGKSYAKTDNGIQKQVVGIIPVVTTAANALYAQALLETGDFGISKYNAVRTAETLRDDPKYSSPFVIENSDSAVPFMSDNANVYTVSQMVAGSFPSISFIDDGTIDRQNLKKIGVVVLRAFLDPGEGNKVNYDIVEAYTGSLDKNAVDPNTGATTFIDKLVNAQSEYIEFYSNCFNQPATKNVYDEIDLFVVPPQNAGSLGFYEEMTKKNISLTDSILKALPMIWEKNEDINEKQIDIVCDAGVSNIAQFIKSCFGGKSGEYDPTSEYASLFKLRSKEDTKTWRDVLAMYDNFCKNIRKDCMFVADGPRQFCLTGNKKIVRPSKPSNTVDGNILPLLKFITGINTNYGAGYCDWFQKSDEFSGDYFWCPPSIQAVGVYLNTDINHNFWSAPAGLNRGVVTALDVAFNPTIRQSNEIYPKAWNYARSYPNDGIVLEGQRTFQVVPSALDRVNVRRTLLRLERMTFNIAKYFVYEDNTVYTRQRLFDALDGAFKEIQGQGGIIRYKIICDDTINTPEVIDRNELRLKIGVVPVKSAEFIICEFNVLRQGGSWTEMI